MLTPSTILFVISIHDLTRRSTQINADHLADFNISIHDLTRRSTCFHSCLLIFIHISIHDLTRRSTSQSFLLLAHLIFQFTTSQGGRQVVMMWVDDRKIFQFTTSQGGRQMLCIYLSLQESYFNSRPHKEVDVA